MEFVNIRDRLRKGERSGALVSAIVDLFAPRLEVKAIRERSWWPVERPRQPETFEDLLSANLTSVHLGRLNDYGDLGISKVSDIPFLKELSNALASAVQHGIDVVNRIYRTDESGGVLDPKPNEEPLPEPQDEANRVLRLLKNLSDATLTEAIWGISHWLFSWRRSVIRSEHGLPVWLGTWPFAIEKTNAAVNDRSRFISKSSGDQPEPPVVDPLNLPAGRLIEVFLTLCQSLGNDSRPFADGSPARQMRDRIVYASGHSGLVARIRLAERLEFFLRTDPDWAKPYLVDPLLTDDRESTALWSKVAHRIKREGHGRL